MKRSNRTRTSARRTKRTLKLEGLEQRLNFSAAFDLIDLSNLRSDPDFSHLDGSNLSVVVIDTAVDGDHSQLQGRVRGCDITQVSAGCDLDQHSQTVAPNEDHGTHVAGIIGSSDPEIGVAGNIRIIGLDVMEQARDGGFYATDENIESALQWVLENHRQEDIVAVNMSLGSGFYQSPTFARLASSFADEIIALQNAGVTVVSAAGNSYVAGGMVENAGSPGILSTLNVGAVYDEREAVPFVGIAPSATGQFIAEVYGDRDSAPDVLPSFTQRPPAALENTLFAPGAMILSAIPGDRVAEMPGTSMAAPMVTGAVALMQQAAEELGGRFLSPAEIQTILHDSADIVIDGDDESSFRYGLDVVEVDGEFVVVPGPELPFRSTGQSYRRLNVYRAVRGVRDYFASLVDPNATLADAVGGFQLWPPSIYTSRFGSPDQIDIQGNLGFDGERSLGATDIDMYRVQVMSPGTISAQTNVTSSVGDTFLRLFDAAGVELAADDDSGDGFNAKIADLEVSPGIYYVGVSASGNSQYDPQTGVGASEGSWTGRYPLQLSLDSADINGTIAAAEVVLQDAGSGQRVGTDAPDIALAESYLASIGKDGIRVSGATDVDFYTFTAPDDGMLLVDIDARLNNGDPFPSYDNRNSRVTPATGVDTFLRVFDESGAELATFDDGLSVDFAGRDTECAPQAVQHQTVATVAGSGTCTWSRFSTIEGFATDAAAAIEVIAGQTYHIGISNYINREYDPFLIADRVDNSDSSTSQETGSYLVSFEFSDRDLDAVIQAFEGVEATTLDVDQTVEDFRVLGADLWSAIANPWNTSGDRFSLPADVDMYAIQATSNGLLELSALSNDDAQLDELDKVDVTISLFDQSGNRLATSTTSPSQDPLMRMEVTAGQTYYVGYSHRGNDIFEPTSVAANFASDTIGFYTATMKLSDSAAAAELDDGDFVSRFRRRISQNVSVLGHLGQDLDTGLIVGGGDVDGYLYTATQTGRVTIRTNAVGDFVPNTRIVVENADGQVVAENDDFGEGLLSEVQVDVIAGQDYFVRVQGADSNTAGGYALAIEAPLTVFTVNSAGDGSDVDLLDGIALDASGKTTLRAAIEQANATAGRESIEFQIPGTAQHVIAPQSLLPTITDAVTIDATTQFGYTDSPLIQIDGAGLTGDGLRVMATDVQISGLSITGFSDAGIELLGAGDHTVTKNWLGLGLNGQADGNYHGLKVINSEANLVDGNVISGNNRAGIFLNSTLAGGNTITANKIGTDSTGSVAVPNKTDGITNWAANTQIGLPNQGNTISGNARSGVFTRFPERSGVTITDNQLGTDHSGLTALPNLIGVHMQNGPNLVTDNVISGNRAFGVAISTLNGQDNVVASNRVGTDDSGTQKIGNGLVGVRITQGSDNMIGGPGASDGNVISGNDGTGVLLAIAGADGNHIANNKIGVDASGRSALPNRRDGIRIVQSASNNTISENQISGNQGRGISTDHATSQNNDLLFNLIGTSNDGTDPLHNGLGGALRLRAPGSTIAGNTISGPDFGLLAFGNAANLEIVDNYFGTDTTETSDTLGMQTAIRILPGSHDNVIAGNAIANNDQGVVIENSVGNRITKNSFWDNASIGIDLGNDGVTANDAYDGDRGANNLQNAPELSQASLSGNLLTMTYRVHSSAQQAAYAMTIEFFVSDGSGQGKTWIGSDFYTLPQRLTDKTIVVDVTGLNINSGDLIVATATDANGNTSEFGLKLLVS